ncbi:MAG: hypothetical protein ACI86C_000943 [Candidatus Latescibacterota bacterium]|jgi:hypothetical protein
MNKMKFTYYAMALLLLISFGTIAQETYGPTNVGMLEGPTYVASVADQTANGTLIYADNSPMLGRPKRKHGNNVVPGKGSDGPDPLVDIQRNAIQQRVQPPILTFIADISSATPSDPTGAVGPNHYVGAWNSSFRIFDKNGNPLTAEASLATLFPGNAIGDPIVFYDAQADRFVITEFDNNPNGFNVAVCAGPNPVTDGWNVYTSGMGTGSFPDYTKFSVFGDKYMVTANIGAANRVFAVERLEMIAGNPSQFVALPLPGLVTSGFYSPQAFHTTDDDLAAITSPCPIVYMQDDQWGGVSDDHLKIWNATVDWTNPGGASMSVAQEIITEDFVGVFDGGSFSNRPQGGGVDIDILQATIMNQAQYRRFPGYNSAVFNFVVDVVAGGGEKAAIRWYELRQTGGDTMPWVIFQEGTYEAPEGRDAYSGSMAMNSVGDIAMGYTSSSATDRIGIHYTGRFDGDPSGVMTVTEEDIELSTAANPSNRLADYVQCTVDPVDDTFWHIAEYFEPSRRDVVSHFSLAPPAPDDIGVISIDQPNSGVLGAAEIVEITIRNFGSNAITNPDVQFMIDALPAVMETSNTGSIAPGANVTYTFTATADLSGAGPFVIEARTLLAGDSNTNNDATIKTVVQQVGGYCQPMATAGCNVDGIKMFVLNTITADDGGNGCNTEPSGGPQGYADRTAMSTDLSNQAGGNVYTLQAQQNWTGGAGVEALSVWIDFDDSGSFETSERLISGEFFQADNVLEDFTLTIPTGSALGPHRLRAKAIDTSAPGDVLDPCTDFDYGEVQDYTVVINDILSVQDQAIVASDFVVLTKENNQFEISLISAFEGVASISIYNVMGQRLAFNNLVKQNDRFVYKLDMSYADTGVYFIKMGDQSSGTFKTGKIIVK